MKRFKIGIFTSLKDDYAVDLLREFNQHVGSGRIDADVQFICCSRGYGESPEVDERIKTIEGLKNLNKNLITLGSREFKAWRKKLKRQVQSEEELRELYDDRVIEKLRGFRTDSDLNIGYGKIMSKALYESREVTNLHPAVPFVGPKGWWQHVMEDQALRFINYLLDVDSSDREEAVLKIAEYMDVLGGGMLHKVTGDPDRGPVRSFYQFPLNNPEIKKLAVHLANIAEKECVEKAKSREEFTELKNKIREQQFHGETPLILFTYENLASGKWKIDDDVLYVNGKCYPYGYCLNREIGLYLAGRGISTSIK